MDQLFIGAFITIGIALLGKILLATACGYYAITSKEQRFLLVLACLFLIGGILDDLGFQLCLLFYNILDYSTNIFPLNCFIRLAWATCVTQHQAMALLLMSVTKQKLRWPWLHIGINVGLSCGFLYCAYFFYAIPMADPFTLSIELTLIKIFYVYLFMLFGTLFYKLHRLCLPAILRHQLNYLTAYFIPYFLFEVLASQTWFFKQFSYGNHLKYSSYAFTTLLCTYALYYLSKRIIGLRFLNLQPEVASKEKFTFLYQFKDILEQLNQVTVMHELAHITQLFFKAAFNLPIGRMRLYIRKEDTDPEEESFYDIAHIRSKAEAFIKTVQPQILIRDELEFSEFNTPTPEQQRLIDFLDDINASVFLPIYERKMIIAYIIVEKNGRPGRLYTNKERDEMVVFTSYLSTIISSLRYSSLHKLQQDYKKVSEALHLRNQELATYKESIRSFMRTSKERKIGILYYKSRRFTLANEYAQELLGIDINTNLGHPVSKTCKEVARKVTIYKTAHTSTTKDNNGNTLVIAGLPSLESHCIILLYYPEIADILHKHLTNLKDPSQWDYLLYLETTKAGELIQEAIPSSEGKLLSFKLSLLATGLSNKPTTIDAHKEDLMPLVELIHQVSGNTHLHIGPFDPKIEGTLFTTEISDDLKDYVTYGYCYKDNKKVESTVRILTDQSLPDVVSVPKLNVAELASLIKGYAHQFMRNDTYRNLLAPTEKEIDEILQDPPLSFYECRERVHTLLKDKSTRHHIHEETPFDPAYNIVDPTIAQAVRLGKKALRDKQYMTALWNKFKNQNKIATLLGVNRSSVNRRCQEYNLK